MSAQEEFAGFLEEYASFLEEMVEEEKQKLDALTSLKVERVEQSVARQQSVAKRLEQMEQLREELQQEAGFGGMTFSEIVGQAPDDLKERLDASMKRFAQAAALVKKYNAESLELVKENLEYVHSSKAGSTLGGVNAYTPDKKQNDDWGKNTALFETKI